MVTSWSSLGMVGQNPLLLAAMLFFFVLLSLVGPSSAHMVMSEPPPINYVSNPNYIVSKADFDYSAPLTPTGSNYPCRGHLKDLDTPQGLPVRTYKQGSTYNVVISGSAVHGGGSCQGALSYDKGNTWIVIKSWVGNCPHATPGGDQTLKLPIPSNAPSGVAVFAWTWFNKVGNREMYMNCAVVTIGGSGTKLKARALSGPSLFLANIGNGCTTASGTDVVFPNPGSVIEYGGDASSRAPPVGNCASQVLTGGGGTGGSGTSGNSVNGNSPTNTRSAPTGISTGAGGQGKTAVASSTFSFVYSSTASSPYPLYPSSLNSPTFTPVAGDDTQSGKLYPTATDAVAYPGTATNTAVGYPATGQDAESNLGCDYWRTQGYVCSAAAPSSPAQWTIIHLSFGFLVFAWVCGFLRVF